MTNPIEQVIVFEKATGRVVSSGTTQLPETLITDTVDVLIGSQANPGKSYVEDGVVIDIPAQPFPYSVFDWVAKQWVDPRTAETQWVVVRAERNKLLVASDWTQMPDAPDANKAAWATYRQALRDITVQADPFNIVWPVCP